MTDHDLTIHEGADAVDAPGEPQLVEMAKFEVVSEDGLFKNGKKYKKGQKIELEVKTGQNFVDAGDVKEL